MAKTNKESMGYNPKPIQRICSNCVNFSSDIIKNKARFGNYTEEKNIRCNLGNFAVKKTANCNQHKPLSE